MTAVTPVEVVAAAMVAATAAVVTAAAMVAATAVLRLRTRGRQ
jgi:hypothetical protein